ncbi:MAG: hypothetical protein AAFY17_01690, partial [Cyanobacteria bacterium J06642_11]
AYFRQGYIAKAQQDYKVSLSLFKAIEDLDGEAKTIANTRILHNLQPTESLGRELVPDTSPASQVPLAPVTPPAPTSDAPVEPQPLQPPLLPINHPPSAEHQDGKPIEISSPLSPINYSPPSDYRAYPYDEPAEPQPLQPPFLPVTHPRPLSSEYRYNATEPRDSKPSSLFAQRSTYIFIGCLTLVTTIFVLVFMLVEN